MINLQNEIENCLKTLRNTNNKEQNFQGRLYAYFLKFEKEGYIIEMETSVNDTHIPFFSDTISYKKKEIDILIYKEDYSEKYAIELKWNYNPGFHYLDRLCEYEDDVIFVKQLVEKANFDETYSVIIVDTNPKHLTKLRQKRKNQEKEDSFEKGMICGEHFDRNKLYDAYEYIIIPFKK